VHQSIRLLIARLLSYFSCFFDREIFQKNPHSNCIGGAVQPCTCKLCKRVFKSRKNLKAHEDAQTCQKHACLLCKKRFRLKRYLTRHLKSIHQLHASENKIDFESFWQSLSSNLSNDPNTQKEMNKFREEIQNFKVFHCKSCKQAWFDDGNLSDQFCDTCYKDLGDVRKFSLENNMIPAPCPPELRGLTMLEEMLIARACPVMRVYYKRGGQLGYSGHVINIAQDVSKLTDKLPRVVSDIPVMYIRKLGQDDETFKDFKVNRSRIEKALDWLIKNNHLYKTVEKSQENLNSLPENDVPEEILSVCENQEADPPGNQLNDEHEDDPTVELSKKTSILL